MKIAMLYFHNLIKSFMEGTRMFVDEDGNIYSIGELKDYYKHNREDIAAGSGAETFEEYLKNCLSKNGTLTELKNRCPLGRSTTQCNECPYADICERKKVM